MDHKEKKICRYSDFWNQLLELGHTSQVKGTVFRKTGPTMDSGHKFMGPQATLTSDQLAINLWVPATVLVLIICCNDTQKQERTKVTIEVLL